MDAGREARIGRGARTGDARLGRRGRVAIATAGLGLTLALILASCSSSTPSSSHKTTTTTPSVPAGTGGTSPGITPTSVTVGQVDDLTIPVPGLFKGAEDGTEAYFDYVNSTGGVNGRKLHLDAQDSLFSGGTVASVTAKQAQSDFALVGGFSLLDNSEQTIIDLTHTPDIGFPLSVNLASDPNVYSALPNPNNNYPLGIFKYLKKTYPQAVDHVGIIWENATASTQAAEAAFEKALKSQGFKIVYDYGAGPFETSFLSNVLAMKSAGVKLFYTEQLPDSYAAKIAQEMQQQNFHPINIEGDAYSNQLVHLGGSAVNNMYISQDYALYLGQDAKTVPAVAIFDKWMKKADPQANFEIQSVYGWSSAELFVQALRAAGANPTRASLVAALDQITSFNAGGLIATANPAGNIPASCFLLAQVQNGKVVRVSPTPSTGFACSPGGYTSTPQPEVRPAPAS